MGGKNLAKWKELEVQESIELVNFFVKEHYKVYLWAFQLNAWGMRSMVADLEYQSYDKDGI